MLYLQQSLAVHIFLEPKYAFWVKKKTTQKMYEQGSFRLLMNTDRFNTIKK